MKTHVHTSGPKLTWKAALLLIATCLCAFGASAQIWGSQASHITNNINGVSFVKGTKVGYAVGANATILKTSDGGFSWDQQHTSYTATLYSVCFPNHPDTGYAAGDSGLILRTVNGGANWIQVSTSTTTRLNSIHMRHQKGFAVGNGGLVLYIDGITTFPRTSGTTSNLYGVYMYNDETIFAAGGGLLSSVLIASYNSGNVWGDLTVPSNTQLNDITFVNDSVGFVVGNNGTLIKTKTYGAIWNTVSLGTTANLRAITNTTDDTIYVAGANGLIKRTDNQGLSWSTLTTPGTAQLNDIGFSTKFSGYAVGNGGIIYKTCPSIRVSYTLNDSICERQTVSFTNDSQNDSTYYTWTYNTDTVSHAMTYTHMFDSAGIYNVTLYGDNGTCFDHQTVVMHVDSNPVVRLGNDTVICNTCSVTLDAHNAGAQYAWYKDGVATGVSTRTITVNAAGVYSVRVTNAFGCMEMDSIKVSVATGINDIAGVVNNLGVYPNPNNKQFKLGFNVVSPADLRVEIFNALGMSAYSESLSRFSGAYEKNISLDEFAAGVYFVNITVNGRTSSVKMIMH